MASKETKLPRYKNPPINEVVAGVVFEPMKQLLIPFLGRFWDRLGKRFPICEHAPPLSSGSDIAWIDPVTGLPLPRVWFVGEARQELVQLQSDRLYYNWRQTEKQEPYPHYETVIKNFREVLDLFERFVEETFERTVVPVECELTYINVIPKFQGWETAGDLRGLFTDFHWNRRAMRFLPVPDRSLWQCSFMLPDGKGQLTARASPGKRIADQLEVIRFELSAKGLGEKRDKDGVWVWFDLAHEWIVRAFSDLAHPDVQTTHWNVID